MADQPLWSESAQVRTDSPSIPTHLESRVDSNSNAGLLTVLHDRTISGMVTIKTRIRYYVPILRWLPGYDVQHTLVADVLAGITVALLLIPQSLSYSSGLAKLDPVYGLYSSLVPVFVYGVLGTSRQLSVGPEALVSLLVGSTIAQTVGPNAEIHEKMEVVSLLCLMVGIITFCMGILRLGFLDSVLSRALLRGFITAVACVILIEQVPALLGLNSEMDDSAPADGGEVAESPFHKLLQTISHLPRTNWVTCVISVGSVSFLFGFGRVKQWLVHTVTLAQLKLRRPFLLSGGTNIVDEEQQKALLAEPVDPSYSSAVDAADRPPSSVTSGHSIGGLGLESTDRLFHRSSVSLPWYIKALVCVPDILVVVATSVLITYVFNLAETHDLDILGKAALQTGFCAPMLPVPTSARIKVLLTPAILIAVLGFVESIVGAKNYGSKYGYTVSANRELVAFGTMNLLGSVLSCFPAFSSIARSQVNDAAGAKTQLAGVMTGTLILMTILFILPIFYYLPKCVMASIVVVAAAALIEWEDVNFMIKIRAWPDMGMMLMTFLITIFWSVEAGTLISIGLSLILVVRHSTKPKIVILGQVMESGADSVDGEVATGSNKIKYKPLHEIFQNPTQHRLHDPHQEILLVKVEESLFFANTGQMKDRLRRAEAYGGWMHIHPSEEETRPIRSTNGPSAVHPSRGRSASRFQSGKGRAEAILSGDGSPVRPGPVQTGGSTITSPMTRSAPFSGEDGIPLVDDEERDGPSPLDEDVQLKAVIFDIENMPQIDASAIQILIEIVRDYHDRGVLVCFVKLRETNKPIFLRSGLLGEVLGSDFYFRKISDAVLYLRERWQWDRVRAGLDPGREPYASITKSPVSDSLDPSMASTKPPLPPSSSFSTYTVL